MGSCAWQCQTTQVLTNQPSDRSQSGEGVITHLIHRSAYHLPSLPTRANALAGGFGLVSLLGAPPSLLGATATAFATIQSLERSASGGERLNLHLQRGILVVAHTIAALLSSTRGYSMIPTR